jgi:glycosyltransferase involved in cell wall biosynthesis
VSTYYIAQELADRGWDLELYASGDSAPRPYLVPVLPASVLSPPPAGGATPEAHARERAIEEFAALARLVERLSSRDRVVHFLGVNFLPVYLAVRRGLRSLLTLQMPADNFHYRVLQDLLTPAELAAAHPVALSRAQARTFPGVFRVVPHGVQLADFTFSETAGEEVAWIGRMTPKKGCREALDVAAAAGVALRVGGAPQTRREAEYFHAEVEPRVGRGVTYHGQIRRADRSGFYRARALLFPLRWEEPFGLAMVEAMACGTPVIAWDRGAVREVVRDGETGFVCPYKDQEAMVAAVARILRMPDAEYRALRRACRRHVEANFTIARTVDGYEEAYRAIAAEGIPRA